MANGSSSVRCVTSSITRSTTPGAPVNDLPQCRPEADVRPAWALRMMRSRGSRRLATLLAALIGLGLIIGVSGARVARQPIGYVGVVRNGGPLDTRTIRQVLMPGQRLTWIGFFSEHPHEY